MIDCAPSMAPSQSLAQPGRAHSVRDCLAIAFDQAGLAVDEHVVIDKALLRPAEVDHLIGDYGKAKRMLGWEPKTSFRDMLEKLVAYEMALQTGAVADFGSAEDQRLLGSVRCLSLHRGGRLQRHAALGRLSHRAGL